MPFPSTNMYINDGTLSKLRLYCEMKDKFMPK